MAEPRLNVLYEDAHLLAVDKPAGLLTQGVAGGESTLEDAVKQHIAPERPGGVYLGTVHRLDRQVSGVVLWARTIKAARRLSQQFAARQVLKEYGALCEVSPAAEPLPAEGVWRDWLTPSTEHDPVIRVVEAEIPGARLAETRYRVEREPGTGGFPEGMVWLRLWPMTGRTHQLRAQAASRGRPIWGDRDYGAQHDFTPGIALHARELRFEHPTLRRVVTVTAPLPTHWAELGLTARRPGGGGEIRRC